MHQVMLLRNIFTNNSPTFVLNKLIKISSSGGGIILEIVMQQVNIYFS